MSTIKHTDGLRRCAWAGVDETYVDYHDREWGRPVHDQQALFEHLCLEGFQAGLSWITILRRREGFRSAFQNFEIAAVADFGEAEILELKGDARIIRNELKIRSVVANAQLIRDQRLDLAEIFWQFAPKQPLTEVVDFKWQVTTAESDQLSLRLKQLGFKFVGSTSMHAMMQSAGMIRDHAPECFRRAQDERELAEN